MNVYYDYQILYNQKFGGISRYYYELIKAIEKCDLANTAIQCKYSQNHYFDGYKGIKNTGAFIDISPAILRRSLRLFGHVINQNITRKSASKADLIHMTYYNPYVLRIPNIKKIITVYDMIEEIKGNDGHLDQVIANKKECIFGADHIIAISENTKADILKLYPQIEENKISVIYIGTEMNPSINKLKQSIFTFPEKYILFVGQRGGYKNFVGFINAVKPLLEKYRDLYVLCIGGGSFSESEKQMIGYNIERVVQMNTDDDILAKAYERANCFVFPSFYEGFGIPTLEAFACNCPAIISNTSSMPEVGGQAVLYFDPNNQDEMRVQIEKAITDDGLRQSLIEKGKERLKLFSWEIIAKQTVDCYKRVIFDE